MITRNGTFRLAGATLALSLGMSASAAHAHICMDAPKPRACNFSQQKVGPCGSRTGRSAANVTKYRPGQTIDVVINETVNHPSHYRIAFNPSGDTFADPTSREDNKGGHPHVLLDNITDESAAVQTVKVTLPNVTCDNCTLQLIQVMYDKGGNGFGGNDGVGAKGDDLYYACADIVLEGEPVAGAKPALDAGAPATATALDAGTSAAPVAPDAGALASLEGPVDLEDALDAEAGGCALGARGDAGGALLLLGLTVLGWRRRRAG
ncbi:MAG: SCE4755 family polysaccharide monooxygenase-like protein [Polyangiales bacterium]